MRRNTNSSVTHMAYLTLKDEMSTPTKERAMLDGPELEQFDNIF